MQKLLDLIRLRNTHPAFGGQRKLETPSDQTLVITWNNVTTGHGSTWISQNRSASDHLLQQPKPGDEAMRTMGISDASGSTEGNLMKSTAATVTEF